MVEKSAFIHGVKDSHYPIVSAGVGNDPHVVVPCGSHEEHAPLVSSQWHL